MNRCDSGSSGLNTENEPELGPGGPPSPNENPAPPMAAREVNWEESDDEEWLGIAGRQGPTGPLGTPPAEEEDILAGVAGLSDEEIGTYAFHILQQHAAAWQALVDQMSPLPQVKNQNILNGLHNTTVDTLGGIESPHGPLECSVCLESYLPEQALVVLPCHPSHHFHRSCLEDWLTNNTTCPLCRNSFLRPEDRSD